MSPGGIVKILDENGKERIFSSRLYFVLKFSFAVFVMGVVVLLAYAVQVLEGYALSYFNNLVEPEIQALLLLAMQVSIGVLVTITLIFARFFKGQKNFLILTGICLISVIASALFASVSAVEIRNGSAHHIVIAMEGDVVGETCGVLVGYMSKGVVLINVDNRIELVRWDGIRIIRMIKAVSDKERALCSSSRAPSSLSLKQ